MEGDDALENTSRRPSLLSKAMSKKVIIAACFSSILIIALAFGIFAYKNTVYEIFIDGTSVGYVKEYDTFQTALSALAKTDGEEVSQTVTAKRKVVFDSIAPENQDSQEAAVTKTKTGSDAKEQKQYIGSEKIEVLAREMLELKQPAVALTVNGNQLAVLPDQETADKVIEGIKAYYTPSEDSTEVLSVEIREDVEKTDTYEYVKNMMDCDSAVQKIVAGVVTPESYTIQQGDTIWDISMDKGVSLNQIQSQNPELDINNIKIGDVINLSAVEPYVTVETVANITSQETIAYSTEKKNDSTLLKGKTKVTQSGVNGEKEVVVKTTKENGVTTNQEIVSSTVTKEPVNEIVAVGTKTVKTYSYTASRGGTSSKGFIRPANGIVTSNYGSRSGGFHTGVDFANSTGTAVVAAKAGTVVWAAQKGGYGKYIIIDHGNGIQTLYAHNSALKVSVGQHVEQGQVIALMGSTGNSSGPHCHFEVRVNGSCKNPWNYIN